jgi:hypothetical protein
MSGSRDDSRQEVSLGGIGCEGCFEDPEDIEELAGEFGGPALGADFVER